MSSSRSGVSLRSSTEHLEDAGVALEVEVVGGQVGGAVVEQVDDECITLRWKP